MLRSFVAGLLLSFATLGGQAFALDQGYYVVVGNFPEDDTNMAAQSALRNKVAGCGYEAFNDFSMKFGFKPGYMTFVLGAYATKNEANAVKRAVTRCVPDAYVKKGAYSGE